MVARTLLSWCPLHSLQESSRALISAAENMTAAHRTSRLSSTTMASEITDSTLSLTVTVMPGWQWAGDLVVQGWGRVTQFLGAETGIPENLKGSDSLDPTMQVGKLRPEGRRNSWTPKHLAGSGWMGLGRSHVALCGPGT